MYIPYETIDFISIIIINKIKNWTLKYGNMFMKSCPEYDILDHIYGDTTATGKHAHPSTKPPSDYEGHSSSNESVCTQFY